MKRIAFDRVYRLNIPWMFVVFISVFSILLSIAYITVQAKYTYLIGEQSIYDMFIKDTPDGNILARMACVLPVLWVAFTRIIIKSRLKRALIYYQMKCSKIILWFKLYIRSEFMFSSLYIVLYFLIIYVGANFFVQALMFGNCLGFAKIILIISIKTCCLLSMMEWFETHFKLSISCIVAILYIIAWIAVNTYIYCIPLLVNLFGSTVASIVFIIISGLNYREVVE